MAVIDVTRYFAWAPKGARALYDTSMDYLAAIGPDGNPAKPADLGKFLGAYFAYDHGLPLNSPAGRTFGTDSFESIQKRVGTQYGVSLGEFAMASPQQRAMFASRRAGFKGR